MSWAGTVLSQPPTRTTASMGWARTISSTSMDMRLRNIMLVGDVAKVWGPGWLDGAIIASRADPATRSRNSLKGFARSISARWTGCSTCDGCSSPAT